MLKLGYKLMSEEHGPADLVRNGVEAERAGFEFAAISDHFFPWLEQEGHSPFAWSVLGALAQATDRIGLMTAVTCPTMRYHPAIVAQAAATVALLSGERFVLGLGTGERLNEHIVGEGWPGLRERRARLAEAVDVIAGLLKGDSGNHRGRYFQLEQARLFDKPAHPPALVIAAAGPAAARLAARKEAGLIATEPKAELVEAYRQAGGKGPCYAEVSICFAASEAEAKKTAHRYFRWSAIGGPVNTELPGPGGFAAASRHVSPEAVAEKVSCGPSPERHLAAIAEYRRAGFDHLILVQVGPEQRAFFDFMKRELGPRLRRAQAA
jgi:G6PDH family F420-dependent oxidoreductase